MKTKHLIVALLVIVAIFIGKGMYVTDNVRETTNRSYQQFELFQTTIHPLVDVYSADVVDGTIKVAHGVINKETFLAQLENARQTRLILLDKYISEIRDTETIWDKELFIRTKEATAVMDKVQALVAANDLAGVRYMIQSGELYGVFDPLQKCLHRIADTRLSMAEDYRAEVDKSLKHFDYVMLLASVLIAIFAVAAVRYKEGSCVVRRKVTRSKRAKKQF
jgi:hypothetical protein